MQKFKLFLGAALVATSWSAFTVSGSATTLERGNFSALGIVGPGYLPKSQRQFEAPYVIDSNVAP